MHKGHRERLRKKFIKAPESLERHELLELLLFFSIPRKTTNHIAHKLLDKFGSFSAIFDAPINTLTSVEGIGLASAILIKNVAVMIRLYAEDKATPNNKIITKNQIGRLLMSKFTGRSEEHIALVLLDPKMRLLFCDIIAKGYFNKVEVNTREIIQLILNHHAKYVIVAHNHPSGLAFPTKNDIETTIFLKETLRRINVVLLDHFIFSDNDYVSLSDSDLKETVFN
ncbi:MAG: hypothetical protein RUMPE_00467 [Eubacteriales bacterium SKADARSKE-1]|nr:hypothetical protein [Eubacteriales bacterium SKADARSKE-1]